MVSFLPFRSACAALAAGLCVLSPVAASAQTETSAPGRVAAERPRLPAEYAPMDQAPRFNSNRPPLVKETEELLRLKSQGPPWIQQLLSFPPESELAQHLGRDSGGTREKAAESIRQVINPRLLPAEFSAHLIPLSRWAILYDDWRKQGGTDVFLTKFEQNAYTVLVLESHNHVIGIVRELNAPRATEFNAIYDRVQQYADVLFTEGLKPLSARELKPFRTSMLPLYVYGWYVPRIEALTGGGVKEADLITSGGEVNDTSSAAGATAVRFFSNGEFAAFMALKPIAAGDLKNPFEARFSPANPSWPGGEIPFWERDTLASRERGTPARGGAELKQRQIEEYLGTFFFDRDGNKLSDQVPVKELERAFLELSREQQLAIVERKMVDEYLTAGMRSFATADYTNALKSWTNLLQLDPENPRAAILLQLAVKARARELYEGNTEKARRDPLVSKAMDAIARQQTALALKRDHQSLEEARDRAIRDYRTRGLGFLSESNYSDSLREWQKILKVDPGNPTALLFKDICEVRLVEQEKGGRGTALPDRPGLPAGGR